MPTLLTIDWDFFFREDPDWLWEHSTHPLHSSMIWYMRYIDFKLRLKKDLTEEFRADEKLIGNIRWMIDNHFQLSSDCMLHIDDDHNRAYEILNENPEITEVICFDAHWDINYLKGILLQNQKVMPENWLGKWLLENKRRKAIVVYSPYTIEGKDHHELLPKAIKRQLKLIKYEDFDAEEFEREVSILHFCRSPQWTPPWSDAKFLDLINEFARMDLPMREFNPV